MIMIQVYVKQHAYLHTELCEYKMIPLETIHLGLLHLCLTIVVRNAVGVG